MGNPVEIGKYNLTIEEIDALIARGLYLRDELALIRCLQSIIRDAHRQLVTMQVNYRQLEKKYETVLQLTAKGRIKMRLS